MSRIKPYVVLCTVPNDEVAGALARELVEKRLAACVNIVPGLRSVYQWQGKIAEDAELLLVIKTVDDRFAELRDLIGKRHPYEVPEIVALPVADGAPPYLAWMCAETRPPEG